MRHWHFNTVYLRINGKDDSTIPFFYQVHLGNRNFLPKAPRTRVLASRNAPRPASICRIIAVSLQEFDIVTFGLGSINKTEFN